MCIYENAKETAKVLGITESQALALEFTAMGAFANIANQNNNAEALFHVGAMHASGQMSKETKDQCMLAIA